MLVINYCITQIPISLAVPCQVTVDNDTIMVFGGRNEKHLPSKAAYEYKIG